MKRFLLLGACFSAVALSTLLARGKCGTPPPVVAQPGAAGDPVNELAAVLSETKSKDTYLAAVFILGRMGPRAQPAVGVILRNGERLGIFEGAFGSNGASGAQAQIVLEALTVIVQGQPMGSPPPTPLPPLPPQYSIPQPVPCVPQVPPGAPVPPPPPVAPSVPQPTLVPNQSPGAPVPAIRR